MRYISIRLVLGLIFITLGVLLILNYVFNIKIDFDQVKQYWPLIPLLFGIKWFFESLLPGRPGKNMRVYFSWTKFFASLAVILISVLLLGRNLELFEIDPDFFWPVIGSIILIAFGISLIRGKIASESGNRFAFMGGIKVGGSPWKLQSGSYFAFMGGIDLDLTTAKIQEGETVLDLTAFMGGIDVIIPAGLPVIYEGTALLGGVTFLDQDDGGIITSRKVEKNIEPDAKSFIRIQARAIMGGVEIKERTV